METSVGLPNMLQRVLLSCGIIAALLSLGTDLLTGKLIKGYSFSAQSMSELGANGSPTRLLFVALALVANAFLIAFAVGVWQMAGKEFWLRLVAGMLFGNAVTTLVATLFFPNQFGVRPEFGTPGVLLMFLSVLCFVLAMVFGAVALHGWMRILSIAIPVAYVLLAILRFTTAARSGAGAVVLVGMQERTMAYGFLLWLMALAIYLLLLFGKAIGSANNSG